MNQRSSSRYCCGGLLCLLAGMSVAFSWLALSQPTPQPTPLGGGGTIEYDSNRRGYLFRGVGVEYEYMPFWGGGFTPDGTLGAIVVTPSGYHPTFHGGIRAELNGAIRTPWDADGQRQLSYRLLRRLRRFGAWGRKAHGNASAVSHPSRHRQIDLSRTGAG
jgi:hypothetical protein